MSLSAASEDERLAGTALPAALEVIPSAAFLVKVPERVLLANAAGRRMLEEGAAALRAGLRAALRGAPSPFDLLEVEGAGAARHVLAVARGAPEDAAARCEALASRLALTPRQAQVLALVARGLPNRRVARELGVTVGAVELHVSALLARLRCANRSQLVARVWGAGA